MLCRATQENAAATQSLEVQIADADSARLQVEAAAEAFKRLHQDGQVVTAKWEDSMVASQR